MGSTKSVVQGHNVKRGYALFKRRDWRALLQSKDVKFFAENSIWKYKWNLIIWSNMKKIWITASKKYEEIALSMNSPLNVIASSQYCDTWLSFIFYV